VDAVVDVDQAQDHGSLGIVGGLVSRLEVQPEVMGLAAQGVELGLGTVRVGQGLALGGRQGLPSAGCLGLCTVHRALLAACFALLFVQGSLRSRQGLAGGLELGVELSARLVELLGHVQRDRPAASALGGIVGRGVAGVSHGVLLGGVLLDLDMNAATPRGAGRIA
jgi:hypothetical protein